jgi:hypothetical protein
MGASYKIYVPNCTYSKARNGDLGNSENSTLDEFDYFRQDLR